MDASIHLDRIIGDLVTEDHFTLTREEVMWLCKCTSQILLREPSLLEIPAPIRICGDIHGQFNDLLRVFRSGGFDESTRYLFLGDYVDRGERSLEVTCLLFAMKLRFPSNVFLLRGNHESPEMTQVFGFAEECARKLDIQILNNFLEVFDSLPLAALVGGKVFCVHGGLSPSLNNLWAINDITRPCTVPEEGMIADLLWSDPSPATAEWGPNDRGETYTWGLAAAEKFMRENGVERIIRGHQLAFSGYDFPFAPDERVVTVFTASSYAGVFANSAAFVYIGSELDMEFVVLPQINGKGMEMEAGPSTGRLGYYEWGPENVEVEVM